MSKYKFDLMSINDWANEHDRYQTWNYTVKGVRRYGLNRDKIIDFIGVMGPNMMLTFEKIWSMLLQVNPKLIKQI